MHTTIRKFIGTLIVFLPLLAAGQDQGRAQVMMMGVFHFANPGLDVVKTDQINVMTDENQAYLDELASRISKFNPTKILLEFEPTRNAELQQRLRSYERGEFELPSNEVYQLGFRIAALSAAETIHGFDESTVQWQAEPLFAYLEQHDHATEQRMQQTIEAITAEMQEMHQTLTLKELLLRSNDSSMDRRNRAMYLSTNHVGDGDNFVGADAAASWWHRNFRMYATVQRHAAPGERVLVIGGQGHTAILRQLLDDDPDRDAVDPRPYF